MHNFKTLFTTDAISLLDTIKPTNKRYRKRQFTKYYKAKGILWLAFYDNQTPASLCVLDTVPNNQTIFIREIQSFISGKNYGKILLDHLLKCNTRIWLTADMTAKPTLLHFYRQFKDLKETKILYTYKRKAKWLHIFYNKNCNTNDIKKWLKQ